MFREDFMSLMNIASAKDEDFEFLATNYRIKKEGNVYCHQRFFLVTFQYIVLSRQST